MKNWQLTIVLLVGGLIVGSAMSVISAQADVLGTGGNYGMVEQGGYIGSVVVDYGSSSSPGLRFNTSGSATGLFSNSGGTILQAVVNGTPGWYFFSDDLITPSGAGRILSGGGSISAPGYAFSGLGNYGLYGSASGTGVAHGGVAVIEGTATTVKFPSSLKSDTGDPGTPAEGQLTCNTFDNACKIYVDAGWRTLVTW